MILTFKIICLFLGLAYAGPVIIGGAIQKGKVTQSQMLLFAVGWVGFVTLQWLI